MALSYDTDNNTHIVRQTTVYFLQKICQRVVLVLGISSICLPIFLFLTFLNKVVSFTVFLTNKCTSEIHGYSDYDWSLYKFKDKFKNGYAELKRIWKNGIVFAQ